MPVYEYLCEACGERFESKQSMTDKPHTACPVCGGKIQRLISGGTGFIFKGTVRNPERGKMQEHSCSLEKNDVTCCGLNKPCGKAPCEEK
jgi:putative FmdB family regulatory protein